MTVFVAFLRRFYARFILVPRGVGVASRAIGTFVARLFKSITSTHVEYVLYAVAFALVVAGIADWSTSVAKIAAGIAVLFWVVLAL